MKGYSQSRYEYADADLNRNTTIRLRAGTKKALGDWAESERICDAETDTANEKAGRRRREYRDQITNDDAAIRALLTLAGATLPKSDRVRF
jgi:hypothetical protein